MNIVLVAISYISGSTHACHGLKTESKLKAKDHDEEVNESDYGK